MARAATTSDVFNAIAEPQRRQIPVLLRAGERDVRITCGGAKVLEYLNAGLIDEFTIALSPALFGSGIRLFEGVDASRVAPQPVRAEPSQRVTHLT